MLYYYLKNIPDMTCVPEGVWNINWKLIGIEGFGFGFNYSLIPSNSKLYIYSKSTPSIIP
jgi:hypothetical protein